VPLIRGVQHAYQDIAAHCADPGFEIPYRRGAILSKTLSNPDKYGQEAQRRRSAPAEVGHPENALLADFLDIGPGKSQTRK
jgi:hypothetical protein